MIPIEFDRIYWFTKLALRDRSSIVPVPRRGRIALIVKIPKNSHGIQSGFYIAEPGRFGSIMPVEGPYRSRIIAAVAAVN